MVVVDSSSLTLYVTVDLSARGHIYVCILHIITIEGALSKKKDTKGGGGGMFWFVFDLWGQVLLPLCI